MKTTSGDTREGQETDIFSNVEEAGVERTTKGQAAKTYPAQLQCRNQNTSCGTPCSVSVLCGVVLLHCHNT